jgi:hypothetical protein
MGVGDLLHLVASIGLHLVLHPGSSTDMPPGGALPTRAQASPIVEMVRPTTVAAAYSRDTATPIFSRSPRLAHPPDQERQADEGY